MARKILITDMIWDQNRELYREIEKEFKHEHRIDFNREHKCKNRYLNYYKNRRNTDLKELREYYGLNDQALKELRRVAGLKNKKGVITKTSNKLVEWCPKFREMYMKRMGSNYFNDHSMNANRDYADGLTLEAIKIMQEIKKLEYNIAELFCKEE